MLDSDKDGLTDLLERAIGTDPDLADTDKDGVLDPDDPSPSCKADPPDTEAERLRRQLAQRYADTTLQRWAWRDTSARCLPIALLAGPLWRNKDLPEASEIYADCSWAARRPRRSPKTSGTWKKAL